MILNVDYSCEDVVYVSIFAVHMHCVTDHGPYRGTEEHEDQCNSVILRQWFMNSFRVNNIFLCLHKNKYMFFLHEYCFKKIHKSNYICSNALCLCFIKICF